MAYSGFYKVKKPIKYDGDHTKVVYRSHWEKAAFIWCERNANVVSWCSEEVVIPYLYEADKSYHRYFVDLKIKFDDGSVFLIEIKPEKETTPPKVQGKRTKRYVEEALTYVKNQNKWQAAEQYCLSRGWRFEVWTEKVLQAKGILPKSPKPLRKLPKYKKPNLISRS